MGMDIRYVTTCDGCGVTHIRDERMAAGNSHGPGWPKGWIQKRGEPPKFFHDQDCLVRWLRENGEDDEADELESPDTVWMG